MLIYLYYPGHRKLNKKFLQMLHGPGDGFYKKSPLAAGGIGGYDDTKKRRITGNFND
jgi:hypothetical protein